MEKEFVTYEIALKLKELGFDEDCLFFWFKKEKKCSVETVYADSTSFRMCQINRNSEFSTELNYISAPLWQQAIDWFRDEHDIVIEIIRQKYFDTYANSYAYEVICKVYKNKELEGSVVIRDNKNNHIFYSYEEAREQAILKTIKLCQKE